MTKRPVGRTEEPGLLGAGSAAATEMNVVVLDLELLRVDSRPGKAIKASVLDIDNATAIQAHKVVMLAELGVKASDGTRVAGPGHQAERDEPVEDAVDGHPGNLRQLVMDSPVKLLGGGMVGAFENGIKNGAALGGDWQAAIMVSGKEPVQPMFFIGRTHGIRMRVCTR